MRGAQWEFGTGAEDAVLPRYARLFSRSIARTLPKVWAEDTRAREWLQLRGLPRSTHSLDPLVCRLSCAAWSGWMQPAYVVKRLLWLKFGQVPFLAATKADWSRHTVSPMCPLCACGGGAGGRRETLAHLLGACVHFHDYYTCRHDDVVRHLAAFLRRCSWARCDFVGVSATNCDAVWPDGVRCALPADLRVIHPDLVVSGLGAQSPLALVDIAVCVRDVDAVRAEKAARYAPLCGALSPLVRRPVFVVLIVIEARGVFGRASWLSFVTLAQLADQRARARVRSELFREAKLLNGIVVRAALQLLTIRQARDA